MGLSDMVLLKENHLNPLIKAKGPGALSGYFQEMRAQYPGVLIEVEVETVAQLQEWPLETVDIIMLDNMNLEQVKAAIEVCKGKGYSAKIEVSGNITLATIAQFKGVDIDRIAIGKLTHSVKAVDLSLQIQ